MYCPSIGAAIGFLSASLFGQNLSWEVLSPYPAPGPLNSAAFGEGRFVAAGTGALIFSEDGGATWKEGAGFAPLTYTAVTYGDREFVAASLSSEVATSDDGRSWTMHTVPGSGAFLTLNHGNGWFVATGAEGRIARSSDGRSWEAVEAPSTNDLAIAAFGNGRFVVVAAKTPAPNTLLTPDLLISTNGLDWVAATAQLGDFYHGILGLAFTGERFAMQALQLHPNFGWSSHTLVSTDGIAWERIGEPGPVPGSNAIGDGLFFANGELIYFPKNSAAGYRSQDGTRWTSFPLPPDLTPFYSNVQLSTPAIAFGAGNYVVAGPATYHQPTAFPYAGPMLLHGGDLQNLTRVDGPSERPTLGAVAASGGTIVAAGPYTGLNHHGATVPAPFLVSTNDGASFAAVHLPMDAFPFQSGGPKAIEFGGEYFVAVGAGGTVLRSSTGLDWVKRISNTQSDLHDVAFGEGNWVAAGAGGKIVTSREASIFELRPSGTELDLHGVAHGNGWLALGADGLILWSDDLRNWAMRATEDGQDLFDAAWGNGRWVAAGAGGLYTSTNGTDWAKLNSQPGAWLDISFGDGLFLAVRADGVPHWSRDGLEWQGESASQPIFGANGSDRRLWLAGASGYIARLASAREEIQLNAIADSNGKIRVTIAAPAGTYRIESKAALNDPAWSQETTVGVVGNSIDWFDEIGEAPARFFRAVKAE